MNKKLNICALTLVLLLLLSLAGCGGDSDTVESAGKSEPTNTETPGTTSATPAPILPDTTTSPEEAVVEDEVIHVSTAGEFLEAIAPGVIIELAPGTYNLTEYLRDRKSVV